MPPKKAAKHDDEKHPQAKDLRRAYEHLGRVEALQQILNSSSAEIAGLVGLAQDELGSGASSNAADLLRAAEHLSFAAIHSGNAKHTQISDDLAVAVKHELDRLKMRAEEDWKAEKAHRTIAPIYRNSLKRANSARVKGAYREALELVRAADALAHVKPRQKPTKLAPKKVAAPGNVRALAANS